MVLHRQPLAWCQSFGDVNAVDSGTGESPIAVHFYARAYRVTAVRALFNHVLQRRTLPVLLALFVWCCIVDFSRITEHGLMADDWIRISHHYYSTEHLQKYNIPYSLAATIKMARFDGRPMLAASLLIEWYVFEFAGRTGWALLGALVLSLNAYLFFLVCRTRLALIPAFLAAALALSFPGDSTHQWLTLAAGRLSYTVGLLACLSFVMRFNILTGVLLVICLLWYEPAVLLFALTALAATGSRWSEFGRALKIGVCAIGAWLGFRILIYLLGERGHGGNNLSAVQDLFTVPGAAMEYSLEFLNAVWLGFVHWPLEATMLLDGSSLFGLATLLIVLFLAFRYCSSAWIAAGYTRPPLYQLGAEQAEHEPTGKVSEMLWAGATGVVLVLASAAPSFVLGPTAEWGIYSRANYVLGFGVALAIAAFVAMGLAYPTRRLLSAACFTLGFTLLASWGLARLELQRMYISEIDRERQSITRMLNSIGEMPDKTVVVISNRQPVSGQRIVRPIEAQKVWELAGLFRAIYGPSVTVVDHDGFSGDQCGLGCSLLRIDQEGLDVTWEVRHDGVLHAPHPEFLKYLYSG